MRFYYERSISDVQFLEEHFDTLFMVQKIICDKKTRQLTDTNAHIIVGAFNKEY